MLQKLPTHDAVAVDKVGPLIVIPLNDSTFTRCRIAAIVNYFTLFSLLSEQAVSFSSLSLNIGYKIHHCQQLSPSGGLALCVESTFTLFLVPLLTSSLSLTLSLSLSLCYTVDRCDDRTAVCTLEILPRVAHSDARNSATNYDT